MVALPNDLVRYIEQEERFIYHRGIQLSHFCSWTATSFFRHFFLFQGTVKLKKKDTLFIGHVRNWKRTRKTDVSQMRLHYGCIALRGDEKSDAKTLKQRHGTLGYPASL